MSSSLARTLHLAFLNLQMKIVILSNRHCTRMIDIIFFLHFINFESIQCNIFSQKKTFEMTNCIEKDCSRYISNELVHRPIFRKSEQQRFFSILLRMQNCKIHGSKRILARFSPFPGFTKINCFASALSLQLSRRTAPFLNYFLQ